LSCIQRRGDILFIIDREGVDALIAALRERGFEVVGPTVRDGAIVYDHVASTADLPVGLRDVQEAGTYRLEERGDGALFGYVVGPQSWKQFLSPPRTIVWAGRRRGDSIESTDPPEPPRYAFFGARPCEIAAMKIQDDVFLPVGDSVYGPRRRESFIVAVNCTEPGGTCFCTSMGTGPGVSDGYDIALTEVIGDGTHHFLVEAGSAAGTEVLSAITGTRAAETADVAEAQRLVAEAGEHMGRSLDTRGVKELLHGNALNPRWEETAQRCLTCTNCTMVCPTCFCSTVEDHQSLDGAEAERVRVWDSCFTLDFSYIHGGPLRSSVSARYRQWLTHKFASWQDQFDSIGCVGCGRCITWCPVGIDVTTEIRAIRETDVRREFIPVEDPEVRRQPT
jgi:formate hydrogenlyase subunit 6/NADH:ubiquinone oxidoreductase subunit I